MKSAPNLLFFIGFNKCATTSIAHMLNASGVRCCHWDRGRMTARMLRNLSRGKRIMSGYDKRFKAFADFSMRSSRAWVEGNQFFREMRADYPNSLFVYNYRSMEAWLDSRRTHRASGTGESLLELHMRLMGSRSEREVLNFWKLQRLNHEREVNEFFRGTGDDFLSISIEDRAFVSRLSAFVGTPLKEAEWLKLNSSTA